jgi:hypothetical protein
MRSLFGVVGLGTQLGRSMMARLARRDEAGCPLYSPGWRGVTKLGVPFAR